jgi:DNA repair protein RecN (Recombination protein N)
VLTLLRIHGFALIDEVEIGFGPGLTVITGETGAGKSILVQALGVLRGGRAGPDLIRAGADEARVEALLELPASSPMRARLAADGREAGEADGADGDGLVVRRVIARGAGDGRGRARAHLGGSIATSADLAMVVGRLVDIASQHDQQSLTAPESALAILDAFAENQAAVDGMAGAFEAWRAAEAALTAFAGDARARAEREDLLRFQLGELEAARPAPGEDEALAVERERLRSAERLFAATNGAEEALYAGDGAVAERIAAALKELEPLAKIDPALAPGVERLREAGAAVEDVARDLGRYARGVRSDPARLVEVEERLHLLQRLARKHGATLAELAARRDALAAELGALGSYDEGLAARQQAVDAAAGRARAAAAALTEARRQAAASLERKVIAGLRELGFSTPRLIVEIEGKDLGSSGADRVRFLFEPNPGDPPRPLAKIASGGELSRLMLAVKQALARTDEVLTYVFDEIDAGVGGGTAEVVGRKLKRLSADRQVIVITHLPQVAAFADAHIRVEKAVTRGRTHVSIEPLPAEARAAEIARMLAGAAPSAQAAAHAHEMLRAARQAADSDAGPRRAGNEKRAPLEKRGKIEA